MSAVAAQEEGVEEEGDMEEYEVREGERRGDKKRLVACEEAEGHERLNERGGLFQCKYCLGVLRYPIKLACGHNICLECGLERLLV